MSQMLVVKLTEDEWADKYRPKRNHLNPFEDSAHGGTLFETYGEELAEIYKADAHYVWTLVEDEGVERIVNGARVVNRLGYFLCEVPWEDVYVSIDVPIEENNE